MSKKQREHLIIEEDISHVINSLGSLIRKLEGQNVLITGGYGMIAGYLVRTILYANKHIFSEPANLYLVVRRKRMVFEKNKNVHYIYGDVAKKKLRVRNINYIIHAASQAAPKKYLRERVDTINANILGLYNILELERKNLKSLLFISSAEIYGELNGTKKVNEEYIGKIDHLSDRSCYIEGKRAAEAICMCYFLEEKLPVKIVRLFHTFGPGLNLHDGRVFSDFIKNGLERKNIEIKGDKTIKRSLLYLSDATTMLFKVLLSNNNGQVFNIGSDTNIVSVGSFAKIVEDCFKSFAGAGIRTIEMSKSDGIYKGAVSVIVPDIDKFKRTFNYIPTITVKETVRRTVLSFLQSES